MSDLKYYVKIRGRVVGPVPPSRLVQMANQGQLSRVHMVSTDGKTWQRASEFPQIFDKAESKPETTKPTARPQKKKKPESDEAAEPANTSGQWHYAINGQTTGPVMQSAIVDLIKRRKLTASDTVWQTGMDEWRELRFIPDFADVISVSSNQSSTWRSHPGEASTGGQVQSKSGDSQDSVMPLIPILKGSTPWVYFLCVVLFLISAGAFFGFLFGLIEGAKQSNPLLIAQAMTALLQMIVLVTAAIFLQRYASLCGRFTLTRDPADLISANEWLARFWLFVSIVVIITIVFTIGIIVYLSAAIAAF